MADEIAIKVDNVSKNFRLPHERVGSIKSLFTNPFVKSRSVEVQHALQNVSFEVKKGEFFGIVGRNGSGKSTLLKMLANIYQPSEGKIYTQGLLVPFIELGVGFNPELTGRENVYLNGALLGFSEAEVDIMYDDIVEFAELERFMDQRLKNYSSGMQVRLAFSMAVRAKADILLIDEVLAVGDADFQRKCFEYFKRLKKDKKTVIFVSHDMTAVREYCDRAVLIEKSELKLMGDATEVADAYTEMFIEMGSKDHIPESNTSKRWGDGRASYVDVALSKSRLTDKDDFVAISVTIESKLGISSPVLGFSVSGPTGIDILGTNTKIRKLDLPDIGAGDRLSLTWYVPNVFNEGSHQVNLAIVYNDGTATADWWDEAKSFKVLRKERTPYLVSPEVNVRIDERVKT